MVNPQAVTTAFQPMPVRARNSLELVDTAIKLYRRYFVVLLTWSCACDIINLVPRLRLLTFFTSVIVAGAAVCCVAAAVRGQNVTFRQCWAFTKPRYWPLWGMYVLSGILLIILLIIAAFGFVLVGTGISLAIATLPSSVQGPAVLLLFLIIGAVMAIVLPVAFVWHGLVQVVVCMEEDKRNTRALGRAYDLLLAHWMRLAGLMTLFGLGLTAIYCILITVAFMLVGFPSVENLHDRMYIYQTLERIKIPVTVATTGVNILWSPFFFLLVSVLYLDLRVRKEALDLEWAAHTTAAAAPATDPYPVATLTASDNRWVGPEAAPHPTPEPQATSPFAPTPFVPGATAMPTAADVPVTPVVPDVPPAAPATAPPVARQCPHCGAAVAADAGYCMQCGSRLAT